MTDAGHVCELPDVSAWLYSEGDAEVTCPDCGTVYGPAYGSGSGDSSGWIRVVRRPSKGACMPPPPRV